MTDGGGGDAAGHGQGSGATLPAKAERLALCCIVALGFLLRLLYGLQPHVSFGDESCYIWLAKNLFEGGRYTYYNDVTELHFPPLFPISLGILHFFARDWETVTRVAYVVFGTLCLFPAYLLGRDMYSRRAGLLACFLMAILPTFTSGVLFAQTLSEPLFLLCLYTGIHAMYRGALDWTWRWHVLAGASVGLAGLTRPEGVLYFGVGCLYFALVALGSRAARRARAIARTCAFVLSFAAVVFPYVLFLHHHTGQWTLSTKSTTSYVTAMALVRHDGVAFQKETWGLNDKGEVHYFAHDFSKSMLDVLGEHGWRNVLKDIRANLSTVESCILNRPWVFGIVPTLLAALGLFAVPWNRRRLRAEALNILVLLPVSSFLIFFIQERYLYAGLIAAILWAALGMERILVWAADSEFPGRLGSRPLRLCLQALLVAIVASLLLRFGQSYFRQKSSELREALIAASWIRRNLPEAETILSAGPEVAFHAGKRWGPVPFADLDRVVSFARARGATHLCLRGRYLSRRPEQRRLLFDEAGNRGDLELVLKVEDTARSRGRASTAGIEGENLGRAFVVYRIR